MKNYFVDTPFGQLVFTAQPEVMAARTPAVVLFHGAFRSVSTIRAFGDQIGPVIYAHLPGHSGARELSEPRLEVWVEAFSRVFRGANGRPLIAAGESLGGLLALALDGPQAAVAIDPFLRTDGLWPLRPVIEASEPLTYALGAQAILAPGADYRHLIRSHPHGNHVVAGDDPLWPERPAFLTPSLLDEESEAWLRTVADVSRAPGGHVLIEESPDVCIALLSERLRALTA